MKVQLLKLVLSSGVAQALLFCANFGVLLFYNSESIAEYGFFITVASLLSLVSAFRLDYFAFFSNIGDPIRELVLTCGIVFLLVVTSVFVATVALGFSSLMSAVCLLLAIWAFSFFYLASQRSLLCKDYVGYGRARFILSLSFPVLMVAFANFGTVGLLVSYCFAQILAGCYLFKRNTAGVYFNRLALVRAFSFKYKIRLLSCITVGVQYLSPALPIILGGYFFLKSELGLWFWLSQMLGAFAAVFKRSLMGFLSAELYINGVVQRKILRFCYILLWASLLFPPFIYYVSVISIPYVVAALPRANEYLVFFPALMVLYFCDALIQPLGALLSSIDKELVQLLLEVLRLLGVLSCFALAYITNMDLLSFTWAYVLVMVLFYYIAGGVFCIKAGRNYA